MQDEPLIQGGCGRTANSLFRDVAGLILCALGMLALMGCAAILPRTGAL